MRALRVVPTLTVLALVGAGVVAARTAPMRALPVVAAVRLPAAAVTPVTLCPGPETLVSPPGSQPLTPTGATVLAAALSRAPAGGRLAPLSATGTSGASGGVSLLDPVAEGVSVAATVASSAGAVRLDPKRAAAATGAAAVSVAVTSATQLTWGRSGDLRGLAATTCAGPVDDAWLVGGGTVDGRRARLLLANPGAAASVVDLTVLGGAGVLQPAAGQGVVLPAHSEVALYLDALSPQLTALAVHVEARSGRFVAVLQDSLMRGITAGGVDDLAAVTPARRQLMTGLLRKAPGRMSVTVAVPGERDAVVRVRLLGTDSGVDLPDGVVTVPAHSVKTVVLPDTLGDGTWTADLTADVDIVAAAMSWVTRPGGEDAGTAAGLGKVVPVSELAWSPAAAPLTGDVLLALPSLSATDGAPTLHAQLVLAGGEAPDDPAPSTTASTTVGDVVAVTLVDAHGGLATRSLTVVPGRTATLAVPDGTAALRLAAGAAGPHLVAAVQLTAADSAGPLLAVLPLRPGPGAADPAPAVVPDPRLG